MKSCTRLIDFHGSAPPPAAAMISGTENRRAVQACCRPPRSTVFS